jgi:23S rRNA pseudouridine1911/1915/1917 synthase
MSDSLVLEAEVPFDMGNHRVDQIAVKLFSEYSRSRIKQWILNGELKVDDHLVKPKDKLKGGEFIEVNAAIVVEDRWEAQDIDIEVVYEDDDIIVVNKPAGLVVHPGAGVPDHTLLNALLFHYPEVASVPRAGIVHRLDKDTTGLMVIARTIESQLSLVNQLQDRSMGREYEAVVTGLLTSGGTIDEPIGRHPEVRVKMAVHPFGKDAVTHYRLLTRYQQHCHVRCKLESGRTHQIRVHMSYEGYPLIGDSVYGVRRKLPGGIARELGEYLRKYPRQALHAKKLTLIHPKTGKTMSWEVDLPEDFLELLDTLKYYQDNEGDL